MYFSLYYFTYVFIHVFFTLARLPSAILNIGFAEICTPISKLSFVAISNSKILKPKELTSQVSILLRLILLVSENRKYFEIFVNTHRWWREHGDWSGLTKFANILFSINCHVAVSGSKFTNGPSKCSQQIGLLPYYHNLLLIFVIFEKKWRLRKKTAKTAFWNVDLGTLAKF